MYTHFKITVAVNIEGFGNKWIHPSDYEEEDHFLSHMYSDIRVKLKKQNYSIGTYNEIFKKEKTAGYIDWAKKNGTLSFSYYFGS